MAEEVPVASLSALVSVIVPCHNAAPWIEECLSSLAAQTHSALEVVVIDDGSSDSSGDLARKFFDQHKIGRVIVQNQAGAAAARQRGLEEARGDFIQYLDADDRLDPTKIAHQLSRLNEAPRAIASGTWIRFSQAGEGPPQPEPNWHDAAPVDYLTETFTAGSMMHPAAWLIPRAVAEAAGPWRKELSLDDDGEYFARVVLQSERVLFCPAAVSYYRSNLSRSLSGRRDWRAWDSAFEVCRASTEALLLRENSARTRRACSLYWRRFAFAAYPEGGYLVNTAMQRARTLDPKAKISHGGRRFQLVASIVGWRIAKRLSFASQRLVGLDR